MSAWIVSKAHIDVLVDALAKREMVFGQGLDDMGRILWEENHKSIRYRYSDEADLVTPPYTFAKPPVAWSDGAVIHEIECYDYQTCEHPEYEESESYRAVRGLRQALLDNGVVSDDEAPWGVPECGTAHNSWQDCETCQRLFKEFEGEAG